MFPTFAQARTHSSVALRATGSLFFQPSRSARHCPISMTNDTQMKTEHLKIVQIIVFRIPERSKQMEKWARSFVITNFILSGLSNNPHWLIGAGGCVPIVALWMMGPKNLRLERYCIKPYDAILTGKSEPYFISSIVPTQQQWNLFGGSLDFVFVSTFHCSLLAVMIALLVFLAV